VAVTANVVVTVVAEAGLATRPSAKAQSAAADMPDLKGFDRFMGMTPDIMG
jgi:hypothetical protein